MASDPMHPAASRTVLPVDLTLQIACARAGVPHRRSILRWVSAALSSTAGRQSATITIRFAGRAEARRLNKAYRGRDYATNVLTFSYPALPMPESRARGRRSASPPLQGDIVICPAVVAAEAREQAKTLVAHHAHLVVHGMLHLLGFDHEEELAAEDMEGLERKILDTLGYPDPYATSAVDACHPKPLRGSVRTRRANATSHAR